MVYNRCTLLKCATCNVNPWVATALMVRILYHVHVNKEKKERRKKKGYPYPTNLLNSI